MSNKEKLQNGSYLNFLNKSWGICFWKMDEKYCCFRLDLLGYLLQMSAVHSSCRVLVYEQVLGLVAGAVVERLGGDGMCIFLHRGDVPQSIPCMAALDFSEKVRGEDVCV